MKAVNVLRAGKVDAKASLNGFQNPLAEVVLVEKSSVAGAKTLYPGLYIFNSSARFMRPVRNLAHQGQIEFIGTLEQVFMSICVVKEEAIAGV